MKTQKLTYLERLKVSWLLFWRGTLMGLAIAFILGQVVAFVGPHLGLSAEWAERINVFGGYLLSIIFVGPLLIQMMLRKRFKGFIMQIVWQP